MSNLYGTVGYCFLNSSNIPNFILVLSDIHSKLPYCSDKINIAEWFYKNMYKANILLEEVPRDNMELKELWETSEHTQDLKKFFLTNSTIVHAIDIRLYLIPFSFTLVSLINDTSTTLESYLKLLDTFFKLELEICCKTLKNMYKNENLLNSKLGDHFFSIKKMYNNYLESNKLFMKITIKELVTGNILEDINEILDSIMEWYCIAKMYELNDNKNIIIHTGVFHSERIIQNLITYYNYKIQKMDGINNMEYIENKEIITGCINLPKNIEIQLFN